MTNIGVIPVRMSSSRFPGKPLKKILNIPMLAHIFERSRLSKKLDLIYVATCDQEILNYCKKIGANCVLTKKNHERASDRVEEAINKIEKLEKTNFKHIIMIQGDEPLVTPEMIDLSLKYLKKDKEEVTNLCAFVNNENDWKNKNIIKILKNKKDIAIYFSRQNMPHMSRFRDKVALRQICIIGFSKKMLKRFSSLQPTNLEIEESIDMNRFVENNIPIKLIFTNENPFPVDTRQDIERVSKLMLKDNLFKIYKNKY